MLRNGRWPTLFTALAMMASSTARAQLYVSNSGGNTISEYDATTGATINASFITVNGPLGITADTTGHLFVVSGTSVGEYDASTGATINASFITGLTHSPSAIALDGSGDLFVTNLDGTIGKYSAITGTAINTNFNFAVHPFGITVDSSGHAFVTTFTINRIVEFDTETGGTISDDFIPTEMSGIDDPVGIAVDDSGHLFVSNSGSLDGTIGEYDAGTGAIINGYLFSGGEFPEAIALDGSGEMFVTSAGGRTVGEYDIATGMLIRSFTDGINGAAAVAFVPEPPALALIGLCASGLLARRRNA